MHFLQIVNDYAKKMGHFQTFSKNLKISVLIPSSFEIGGP
jgi:hypothetical protein